MTTALSSYTTTLPDDVLLDTGILYVGSSIFSAHDGGIKFDPGSVRHNIKFDGKRSPVKGLDRTDEFMPKLAGNILEFSPTTVPRLEPGATNVTPSGAPSGFTTGYQPKNGGVLYATGDYLTNVRVIYERGDGTFVQIRFPVAMVNKWDLAGTQKDEGKLAIEIEARLDLTVTGARAGDPPYVIEYFTTNPQA